jgi:hypothetical protein
VSCRSFAIVVVLTPTASHNARLASLRASNGFVLLKGVLPQRDTLRCPATWFFRWVVGFAAVSLCVPFCGCLLGFGCPSLAVGGGSVLARLPKKRCGGRWQPLPKSIFCIIREVGANYTKNCGILDKTEPMK